MAGRWYKRCGADFIHGTMMLTLEEKGAYSLCLDLIYDRGGPIPDDARWLSGVCGVSMRKWNSIRDRLVNLGKLAAGDGLLSNARADLELVSAELSSRERAESGAKGGRKRAQNAGARTNIKGLGEAELKPKDKIRGDEKVTRKRARDPDFEVPDWVPAEPWAAFAGMRRRKKKPLDDFTAKQLFGRLRSIADAGWSIEDVITKAAIAQHDGFWMPDGRDSNIRRINPATGQAEATRATGPPMFDELIAAVERTYGSAGVGSGQA